MQTFVTHLWFDRQAEEAARFYVSLFADGKLGEALYYDETVAKVAEMPVGSLLSIGYEINGQRFVALNGGPAFKLSEAISLMLPCDTQAELDFFWDKLSEGGEIQQCGWVKDRYGLSWQIFPAPLDEWIHDSERGPAVMHAVMEMKKLDFAPLVDVYKG